MKRFPTGSPSSWRFQANMHSYPPDEPGPFFQGWKTCQHGNWWFLPWHRAYLLYLERILRVYSGDPGFMLPYWDWTDPNQQALPARFLDPASPLFEPERNPEINAGSPINPAAVSWPAAARQTTFSTPIRGQGLGSQRVQAPGMAASHGAMEAYCHDLVHDSIGGLMGDPATAARDPIFWLHHANVDRLWGAWLRARGGTYLPQDALWRRTPFLFYGPSGQGVYVTAAQLLNSEGLGYRYANYPPMPAMILAMAPQAAPGGARSQGAAPTPVVAAAPGEQKVTLAAQDPPRKELTAEPLSVTFTPDAEGKRRLEAAGRPMAQAPAPGGAADAPPVQGPSLQVVIDDIRFDRSPGRFYEVYVNLPGPAEATGPESLYFGGSISFFALSTHHGGDGHAMAGAAGKSAVVDVTETVARLRAAGKLGDDLKVTLIERAAAPRRRVVGAPAAAAAPQPKVTIGSIRLQGSGQ